MQYELRWLVENQVIWLNMIEPPTTKADIQAINLITDEMLILSGAEKIHFIVDTRQETESPKLNIVSQFSFLQNPKLGWFLLLTHSTAVQRFLGSVVTRLLSIQHRQFHTLGEAIAFLAEVDSNFDPSTVDKTCCSEAVDLE